MDWRSIAPYAVSNLLSGLAGLVSIAVFSRLLAPDGYGLYAILLTVAALFQTTGFYWLQTSIIRLHAEADDDLADALRFGFGLSGLATAAVWAVAFAALAPSAAAPLALAGFLLLVLRSWVGLVQNWNRVTGHPWRFATTAAVQAFGSILLAIPVLIAGASDPIVPILAAAAASLMASAFCPSLARLRRVAYARVRYRLIEMWRYGAPLALVALAFAALAACDRLLILGSLGPAEAGAYSASYGIAERALGLLFLSVTLATKPLVFNTFEHRGAKAASDLLGTVAAWLMAIGFPVTTVLVCAPSHITAAILGAGIATAAATVLPWAAVGALLSAFLSVHFALSFQISRRTSWMLLAVAPAAALNGIANILLLPRFGIVAAGWSTVAGYGVALALAVWLGRRHFPVPFRLADALRATVACVPLSLFVQMDFPQTLSGLALMLGGGALVYAASVFALDVARIRSGCLRLAAHLTAPEGRN